jgi:Z1 domain
MNHTDQILKLLRTQIPNEQEVDDIRKTAADVAEHWVKPLSGGKEQTNGLVYGLVQSGKTGVLTVTGAMGADEGYRTIIVLTSDNDALYDQTLGRVQEAFPGMDILGKPDCKDQQGFLQRVKSGTCAIVATKNASVLGTIIENLKKGNLKGLSCLLIDDEADQASLNTRAAKADGSVSGINALIAEIRSFFDKNTYLQVTATPQALFLQTPDHPFRPKFTLLSRPGQDYVGGDDFFGDGSTLVREFPLTDILALAPGSQPSPTLAVPASLYRALDTFMVAATYKRSNQPDQNCAFLCHVSTRKDDHAHIVNLLRRYKTELSQKLSSHDAATRNRLKIAYDDLAVTHAGIRAASFDKLLEAIKFFSPGITVKLVNGETDEDVAVRSPYNLFVGGNKLGRGVTIKNLLVSYYGRNPRTPQADTVLQHARMYGYRRKDIGLLRLFLPPELDSVFKAINRMQDSLRKLIENNPSEEFRGLLLEGALRATRKNVLVPGAVGVYTGGSNYNPAQVLRDNSTRVATSKIDNILSQIADKTFAEMSLDVLKNLVGLTMPDDAQAEHVWNTEAIIGSVEKYGTLTRQVKSYVYVDRDRGLDARRRETQGIIEGREVRNVPGDKIALFMLRTTAGPGKEPVWWPQLRFPSGRYAFAFSV